MHTVITPTVFSVVVVIHQPNDGDGQGYAWHCFMAHAVIRFKA